MKKIMLVALITGMIAGALMFIRAQQNARLDNTYVTLIRDGEVIIMTQRELLEYYKNK